MHWQHRPFKLGVFGASGSGKTTYALRWLTHATGYRWRFVFDGEDGELAGRLGLPAIQRPEDLLAALGRPWIVFDPRPAFKDPVPGFRFFVQWVHEVSLHLPGRKLFVCDELWRYCGTSAMDPALEDLVFTGRRRRIDCCFVSNRPNAIHNAIRDQLTEAVAFHLQDENATKYLARVGFNPEELRELATGHYVARNLYSGAEVRGSVF